MEKYKLDYSGAAGFKGLKILFEHIEEGLAYAKKNNIKDIVVWSDNDYKQIVNFDFLKNKSFIKTFHWFVSLSKKSNIQGLYCLSELVNFTWAADFHNIDLSKFPLLENINMRYDNQYKGWEDLNCLKKLQLSGVKTDDLSFLQETVNLEYLRIIRGSFTSIHGLEKCSKLKTLFIQSCNSLVHVKDVLQQMSGVENLLLESCKNVELENINLIGLKNISIMK